MRWTALFLCVAFAAGAGGCGARVVTRTVAPAGTAPVLFVADVHFDPFAVPALVPRLEAAPASRWAGIFASVGAMRESGYKVDTNAALLDSSLGAMHEAVPDPRVVLIAGDFLAHGFRDRFRRTAPRRDEASYDRFVDATMAYLALAFAKTFPRALFVVTIGNNDGYCGDYESTPGSPFLAHMARAWKPLVDRGGAAPGFLTSFSRGGWYEAALPFDRVRVLVANSVFWSRDYDDVCGRPGEPIGAEQQRALVADLARSPHDTHWWFLTHIPPGIDSFASLRGLGLETMYRPEWLAAFLALRTPANEAFELGVAGHTHMNDFRLAAGAGGRGVAPFLLLPSITRFSGNDPAFLVADVTPDGHVADYTAYHDSAAFAGIGARAWSREYTFDAAFGVPDFSPASLASIQRRLAASEVLRDKFYVQWYSSGSVLGFLARSTWHRTWCAQDELQPRAYLRCRGKI